MLRSPFRSLAATAWLLGLSAAAAVAQEVPAKPAGDSPPVAAFVNGEPLYVAELEGNYELISKRRRLGEGRVARTKAEMLDQLINRRLVMQALERVDNLVTPDELELHRKQLEAKAREKQMTLEQMAHAQGLGIDTLNKEMYWQLAWDRYLDRHLVDALEEYFDQHKKELDGTELRASHILLRPEKYSDTPAIVEVRASKIREAIEGGKISFEDAAQRFSAGPSRHEQGDLGFFPRKGVMSEEFSKAAFALEKGQLSAPVTSAFGTHLIRVTDVKPGKLLWTQVIPQIKISASAELLEEFAERERKQARIEYTGLTPYFKTEGGELVVPAGDPEAAAE
jgi:parvulin-like peptidyl-prolyl isomerase